MNRKKIKTFGFLIGGTSFVLSFLIMYSQALAVDWSKKVGVGVFTETEKTSLGFSGSHGISINYGIAERIRIGLDLGVFSSTVQIGTGESKSSISLFSWSIGGHGAIDILSKEGGSLYGLFRLGYGRVSSKIESPLGEGVTEMQEGPGASGFSIGAGIGVEAFVAQSVGVALEGLFFNFSSGSLEVSENGKTIKIDVSGTGFFIFPSARLVVRYYF